MEKPWELMLLANFKEIDSHSSLIKLILTIIVGGIVRFMQV